MDEQWPLGIVVLIPLSLPFDSLQSMPTSFACSDFSGFGLVFGVKMVEMRWVIIFYSIVLDACENCELMIQAVYRRIGHRHLCFRLDIEIDGGVCSRLD